MRKKLFGFAAAAGAAAALGGAALVPAQAVTVKAISCTAAGALNVVKNGAGADYTITNGSGWCVQGIPFQGDWSVSFSGTGHATTFNCTPVLGGTVGGLTLNMTLNYHNNRTGASNTVNETWTTLLPLSTWNTTLVSVNPGANIGLIETHIFNQCPPAGTPSAYFEFQDSNAA